MKKISIFLIIFFLSKQGFCATVGNPYGHYKLNDNAANTTVTDNGTGSNNGTASSNTSTLTTTGKINSAFIFNGSSDNVQIDGLGSGVATNTTGSLTGWIIVESSGSGSRCVFGLGDESDDSYAIIYVDSSNKLSLLLQTALGGNIGSAVTSSALPTDEWVYFAVVQDGTACKIYINGQDDTAGGATSKWFNDVTGLDAGRIGARRKNGATALYYDGSEDDLRYYSNDALTETEVKSIYFHGHGTEDTDATILKRRKSVL